MWYKLFWIEILMVQGFFFEKKSYMYLCDLSFVVIYSFIRKYKYYLQKNSIKMIFCNFDKINYLCMLNKKKNKIK